MNKIKNILISLGVGGIFLFLFFSFVNFNIISGSSMYPTIEDEELVTSYKHKKPKVGDIVVFNAPEEWNKEKVLYIKRLIAKGGDTIEIKDNKLYVNNILVKDISIRYTPNTKIKFTVENGYYFVMGDNTLESADSLYYMLNDNFRTNFLIKDNSVISSVKKDSKDEEINKYVKMYNK